MGLFSFFFKNRKEGTDVKVAVSHNTVDLEEYRSELPYLTDSSQILEAKTDEERLRLCRQLYPGLRAFVSSSMKADGELPPSVPCRDVYLEMLMRFGCWDEAERIIRECASMGAFGHTEYRNPSDHDGLWVRESGEAESEVMRLRRAAAEAALAFLAENPGALQSKIYKVPALADVDHDSLVWFCRSSHQIKKVKSEKAKTNRLYVAGRLL